MKEYQLNFLNRILIQKNPLNQAKIIRNEIILPG